MNRTRVKICGITRAEDALSAADAGADAIGFVFWPGSKRFIDADSAKSIRRGLPASVTVVGVFVDADADTVHRAMDEIGINAVQLGGRCSGNGWDSLPRSLSLIRVVSIEPGKPFEMSMRMNDVNDYLLDNGSGGTGVTFDWTQAGQFRTWGRIWLAGGLKAENVGEAIRTVRPHAVDVSTGVESSPGIKSPELIRSFIDAVHHADHAIAREGQHAH